MNCCKITGNCFTLVQGERHWAWLAGPGWAPTRRAASKLLITAALGWLECIQNRFKTCCSFVCCVGSGPAPFQNLCELRHNDSLHAPCIGSKPVRASSFGLARSAQHRFGTCEKCATSTARMRSASGEIGGSFVARVGSQRSTPFRNLRELRHPDGLNAFRIGQNRCKLHHLDGSEAPRAVTQLLMTAARR